LVQGAGPQLGHLIRASNLSRVVSEAMLGGHVTSRGVGYGNARDVPSDLAIWGGSLRKNPYGGDWVPVN